MYFIIISFYIRAATFYKGKFHFGFQRIPFCAGRKYHWFLKNIYSSNQWTTKKLHLNSLVFPFVTLCIWKIKGSQSYCKTFCFSDISHLLNIYCFSIGTHLISVYSKLPITYGVTHTLSYGGAKGNMKKIISGQKFWRSSYFSEINEVDIFSVLFLTLKNIFSVFLSKKAISKFETKHFGNINAGGEAKTC